MRRVMLHTILLSLAVLHPHAFVEFRGRLPNASVARCDALQLALKRPPPENTGGRTNNNKKNNNNNKFKGSKVVPRSEQRSTPARVAVAKGSEIISLALARKAISSCQTHTEINRWMQTKNFMLVSSSSSSSSSSTDWSISDQLELVKLLQERRAFDAMVTFLTRVKTKSSSHVKVFTTAMFALALSRHHRHQTRQVFHQMEAEGILPTDLTFIALLGSMDGTQQVEETMQIIDSYKTVPLSAEVFHSAIFALLRGPSCDRDWRVALNLLQSMRRHRLAPTLKTYHAVLQVLARTGKVQLAKSLLQQLQNSLNLEADEKIWAAMIHVCARAGDADGACAVIQEMQLQAGMRPNLRHCTALLNAFAKTGEDGNALIALDMMLGKEISNTTNKFQLPPIPPDLIALNTVISACAKAQNTQATQDLFQRLKAGEFVQPGSSSSDAIILPDKLTYHNMLIASRDPTLAKELVKEMRWSRRSRYGAIPPTNVTYAHAITVCQKAKQPDLETAELLLQWARDDGIELNAYIYSAATWTAQKTKHAEVAVQYYQEMKASGCIPNAAAYNGVISALCDLGDIDASMEIYLELRNRSLPISRATFKHLVSAIRLRQDAEDRKSYLERIFVTMRDADRFVRTGGPIFDALINIYGAEGSFDQALAVYNQIVGQVDAVCLRSILLAAGMSSPPRWLEGVTILHTSDIVEGAAGPGKVDQVALSNAIVACSKANEFEEGLNILQLYGERAPSLQSVTAFAMSCLIAACGRRQRPELAMALLNEMKDVYGVRPNERSYRNAVTACNQAQHQHQKQLRLSRKYLPEDCDTDESEFVWWECSLALLQRMRDEDLNPDTATYSSAISACEAAGEWQRALGVLQMMLDDEEEMGDEVLNLYCFNAAISALEKGNAWIEALELYEQMIERGGPVTPNFVTLGSLIVALDMAGQKELAQEKYEEGIAMNIIKPWRWTRNINGDRVYALDLHNFSAALARAAVRSTIESSAKRSKSTFSRISEDGLVIITGKGLRSEGDPVLRSTVATVLREEFGVCSQMDEKNTGRIIVKRESLEDLWKTRYW